MHDSILKIACTCGTSTFAASGSPLFRAICHCGICQRFNKADYADILIFRGAAITVQDDSAVIYAAHKSPPLVLRGTCTACGMPAIERLRIPLMPRLTIVPTRNINTAATLPDPALHMFYEARVQDVHDDLPKYSGYLRSQIAFSRALMGGIIQGQQ